MALLLTTEPGAPPTPPTAGACASLLAPADHPPFAAAFLAHWRPDACVWASGRIRPALMDAALRHGPVIVAGARAEPARGRPLRLPAAIVSRVDRIMAVDAPDAQAWRRLGAAAGRVEVAGPLQSATPPPRHDEAARRAIASGLAGRPVWFAVAVPDRALGAVLDAHAAILRRTHRALLILEPASGRPPADLDPTRAVLHDPDGDDDAPADVHEVLVTLDPGLRGLWHRVAPVTLMGDTLGTEPEAVAAPADPDAPAALGSAVVHGPRLGPYAYGYARLMAAGASREVAGPGDVAAAVEALLAPDRAARQAHAAWSAVTRGAEATDRLAALVLDMMGA